ncbi:MAG: zinc-ribbon domain-containing protein [Promethearchaeota archaeon]|nr:MAG: zinc-ribbon domain-containing protein [Candidatus Lokiarchaeota archaeon]
MTTTNPTGWCPRCQQNVLLKREEIDTCLAIILLIFTAGIGLIIYYAIYHSRPENRCVHCGGIITTQQQSPYTYQSSPQIQQSSYSAPVNISEEVTGARPNFCALCGEKLDVGAKFCQNCGSQITEN